MVACLRAANDAQSTLHAVHALLSACPSTVSDDAGADAASAGAGDSSAPPADLASPPAGKRKRPLSVALHHSGGSGASSLVTLPDGPADAAAASKGLKHFSLKVCEKVEGKGCTNYNEVADELVRDAAADAAAGLGEGGHDEKNVRRRVYDALNVLEALGIIGKTKRDISWVGWPPAIARSGAGERERLEAERARGAARLRAKAAAAGEAAAKAFCLSNLVLRNRDAPLGALIAAQEAGMMAPNPLSLPFMLIHAPPLADVDISISPDERSATLDLHGWPFQIYDDERTMLMMGMGQPQPELAAGLASAGGEPGPAGGAPVDGGLSGIDFGGHHDQQGGPGAYGSGGSSGAGAGGMHTPLKPEYPGPALVGPAGGAFATAQLLSPSAAVSAMDLGPPEPGVGGAPRPPGLGPFQPL